MLPKKLLTKKTLPVIIDAFFNTMTPYQVVLGHKGKKRTARLRDILPFSQGHALKRAMQLKVIKEKKILLERELLSGSNA